MQKAKPARYLQPNPLRATLSSPLWQIKRETLSFVLKAQGCEKLGTEACVQTWISCICTLLLSYIFVEIYLLHGHEPEILGIDQERRSLITREFELQQGQCSYQTTYFSTRLGAIRLFLALNLPQLVAALWRSIAAYSCRRLDIELALHTDH